MMYKPRFRAYLAALLLAATVPAISLGLVSPAQAQAADTPAPQAPTADGATEGTAPADASPPTSATQALVRRVDAANGRMLEIKDYLRRPAMDLAGIVVALPERSEEAQSVIGTMDDLEGAGSFAPEAIAAQDKLRSLDRIFTKWRQRLQREVAVLDPWREQLRSDAEFVNATVSDAGYAAELPGALRTTLTDLNGDIENTLTPLRKRLDVIVAADVKVGELQNALRDMSVQLESAQLERQQRPLTLTAPPIWKFPERLGPARDLIALNLTTLVSGVADYFRVRTGEIYSFLGVVFLLLVVMFRLRRSVLDRSEAPASPADQLLIRYPISVILLVVTLLGPSLLLPDLPAGLTLARGLLDVALLWRLMPALVSHAEVWPLRVLLLLAAVYILQIGLLGDPWYGRFINLLVGASGILLFRRLGRAPSEQPSTDAFAGQPLVRATVRVIGHVAPWILAVGLLAEAVGARILSQQAIGATVFASLALSTILAADAILRTILDAFVAGPGSRWFRSIRTWPQVVRRNGTLLVRLILAAAFLNFLPSLLPLLQPVWAGIGNLLESPLTVGNIGVSLGGVFGFVIAVVLAVLLARFVRFLLDEDVLPRLPVHVGSASAASRLIYYAMVAGGIVFALAASGVELTKLTIIVSALGVGIGFGLQNIVNNFVSGLIIAFERPVREGDQVSVGQTTGRVQAIGLRATRIRTFDGAEVIVPNGSLISGEVTNWTLTDRMRRIEVLVGVDYASDARKVQQVLNELLKDLPGIASIPVPSVSFKGFGASSMDFAMYFWVPDADDRADLENEARLRILESFEKAGISIPFPRLDVRLERNSE